MKRTVIFILVVIIAALSVMSVSAAPRAGYYDQIGNKYWCNSDSYGCWVTNEDGGKDYIMFWSESAAEAIMGKNSGAPIGSPISGELFLAAPIAEVAEDSSTIVVPPEENKCSANKCTSPKVCNSSTGACECPAAPEGKQLDNEENCTYKCIASIPTEGCGDNKEWSDESCECVTKQTS